MTYNSVPTGRFLSDNFRDYWLISVEERAELHTYRLTGASKPEQISWGDWIGPQRLKLSHLRACYLFALGMLGRYVSKRVGYTESRLSIILSSSQARRYVKFVRDKHQTYYEVQAKLEKWRATRCELHGAW